MQLNPKRRYILKSGFITLPNFRVFGPEPAAQIWFTNRPNSQYKYTSRWFYFLTGKCYKDPDNDIIAEYLGEMG